jgi:hypothetical protein
VTGKREDSSVAVASGAVELAVATDTAVALENHSHEIFLISKYPHVVDCMTAIQKKRLTIQFIQYDVIMDAPIS